MSNSLFHKAVFAFTILFQLFIFSVPSQAQDLVYKRFLGKWVTGPTRDNYLKIDENFIQAFFIIEDLDGIPYVRMESPDADAFNMPADEATVSGEKIIIYFSPLNAVFKGKINKGNDHLTGTLAFLGKTVSMSLMKIIQEQ
jgi:hypothetical protein